MYKLKLTTEKVPAKNSKIAATLVFFTDRVKEKTFIIRIKTTYGVTIPLEVLKNMKANGAPVVFHAASQKAEYLFVKKVTADKEFTKDYFRNFFAGFLKAVADIKADTLHIELPAYSLFDKHFASAIALYQSCVEGLHYGNYDFDKYKKREDAPQALNVSFEASNRKELKAAIEKGNKVMTAVAFTRDLQNEPGNVLYPHTLAERIKKQFAGTGVRVTILNEKALKAKKMGGILAVGSGSIHPPRLVVLEYSPRGAKKHIALVGKGVTFDSGGISLKPASDMGEMKADMSGAAVVAGTLFAAAQLKLPVRITGVIPSAENLPSGSSFRPGDIVTTSSGKTIEVDNTDAEGRIILADALHFASQKKPDAIIDLATLTGACVVALGEFVAGLFTKNDTMADQLTASGQDTFERLWRLPLWDDFHMLNKSDVADVKNIGGRWGGAISAAKFLENWVNEDIPWTHLDIAGPAMAHKFSSYSQPYMTGFGVRLLVDYLEKV